VPERLATVPRRLDVPVPDRRRLLRTGVGCALLLYAALAILQIFAAAPFITADESAHVDYALRLAHGELPVTGEPVTEHFLPEQPRGGMQHVSNHPPLYHAIVGPVLRAAESIGDPRAGLIAARLITASFTLGTIVLVAALALALTDPGRILLAVASAGVAAVFPPLMFASVTVQNDALAAMLATGVLLSTTMLIRRGPSRRWMVALSLFSAAGSLTRVTLVPIIVLAAIALVVASVLRSGGGSRARAAWRGAAQGAVVLGSVLVASGWFYAISVHRYGDPIGSVAYDNARLRPAEPSSSSVLRYLTDPGSWFELWRQSFGARASRNLPSSTPSAVLAAVFGVAVLAGAVVLVTRAIRARRVRLDRERAGPDPVRPERRRTRLAGLVVAGSLAVCIGEIAVHVTRNGAPHGRYLAPAIAALAIGVAAALLALPRPWGTAACVALFAACAYSTLAFEVEILHRLRAVAGRGWFATFADSLAFNGAPASRLLLVVLLCLAVAGLVGIGACLGRLDARAAEPVSRSEAEAGR
jgi:4-amino-4-deoxy-L-arabinose transferase-like glycosyltransferase